MKKPLNLSLFQALKKVLKDEIEIIELPKPTLIEISHVLEDTVISNKLPAMVFTGFQESKYWLKEIKRYRELAGIAHSVAVFSGPPIGVSPNSKTNHEIPFPGSAEDLTANTINITLADNDSMRQEWFLIVLTKEFSVLLCGLDKHEPVSMEAERKFETIISFDPAVITIALALIESVLEHYRPEKLKIVKEGSKNFPPCLPTPKYLSIITSKFIEQAAFYRPLLRRLDQEIAMRATINRLLHEAGQPITSLLMQLELLKGEKFLNIEDLNTLLSLSERLKGILDQLSKVSEFKTESFDGFLYLDINKPLFEV